MTSGQLYTKLIKFEVDREPSDETIKEIILAILDFLEERIDNERIDAILERIETLVEHNSLGVLKSVFNVVKLHSAAKKA